MQAHLGLPSSVSENGASGSEFDGIGSRLTRGRDRVDLGHATRLHPAGRWPRVRADELHRPQALPDVAVQAVVRAGRLRTPRCVGRVAQAQRVGTRAVAAAPG